MTQVVERRNRIVAQVNQQGVLSFAELMKQFPEVSEMTLRKDLKYLDGAGQIIRVHGGARSIETISAGDTPLRQRLTVNVDKKREIARKACSLVTPGSAIFLDSGSTMTELSKIFPDLPCTVFTGGLSCLNELCKLKEADVYVLGGKLNKNSLSVRDVAMASMMDSLHFDLAFISVNGYTRSNGFTCRSSSRWELEKVVLRRSDKVVVLMDSDKVNVPNPFSVCMPQEVDILVSDDGLPSQLREELQAAGVTVL